MTPRLSGKRICSLYVFAQSSPQSPPGRSCAGGGQGFRLPAERKYPSTTIGVRAGRTFPKCPLEDQGSSGKRGEQQSRGR